MVTNVRLFHGITRARYMPPAKGAPEGGGPKGSRRFLYLKATSPPTSCKERVRRFISFSHCIHINQQNQDAKISLKWEHRYKAPSSHDKKVHAKKIKMETEQKK